jgi:hypothetical protein
VSKVWTFYRGHFFFSCTCSPSLHCNSVSSFFLICYFFIIFFFLDLSAIISFASFYSHISPSITFTVFLIRFQDLLFLFILHQRLTASSVYFPITNVSESQSSFCNTFSFPHSLNNGK